MDTKLEGASMKKTFMIINILNKFELSNSTGRSDTSTSSGVNAPSIYQDVEVVCPEFNRSAKRANKFIFIPFLSFSCLGRTAFLILALFSWMQLTYALNGQETFLQGNNAYQENDYEKALNLYSKIEKRGSAVWYNMGNCHYHLGHEADAIACWKRSQKGGSASLCTDSACNIDAVLQESEQNKTSFVHKLSFAWNAGSVFMIQLIFLLVWMVFCCALYLSKRGKKYKVATFVFGVLILPLGANLVHRYIHRNDGYAIVHTEAQLYAGPNEQYHVVGTVGSKEQLVVYTKNDNWYKVASGKQNGWINARSVVVI